MQIIDKKSAMRQWARDHEGEIGFVPTMGFLHEGHMSLVRRARAENKHVVVSIYVNPAQFNDKTDFEKYPIDLPRDTAMLEAEGVDALFLPNLDEVYPHGVPGIKISYPELMAKLCGNFRPGHFEGVLLIVHNLFEWMRPTRAYFGLKDYQQFLLIKHMTRDLELPVEVVGCELVREASGIALSSRNVRIDTEHMPAALKISAALRAIAKRAKSRVASPESLRQELRVALSGLEVEYAEICAAEDLHTFVEWPHGSVLIAVAAWVGGVRLIDNCII